VGTAWAEKLRRFMEVDGGDWPPLQLRYQIGSIEAREIYGKMMLHLAACTRMELWERETGEEIVGKVRT
jgi:hypothetical protein